MCRLAALMAAGELGTMYSQEVDTALGHGVTVDEIVGVLISLVPVIGSDRVSKVAAATLTAISRVGDQDTRKTAAHVNEGEPDPDPRGRR
jgi:hypothetical protein